MPIELHIDIIQEGTIKQVGWSTYRAVKFLHISTTPCRNCVAINNYDLCYLLTDKGKKVCHGTRFVRNDTGL